jgi:dUTPase
MEGEDLRKPKRLGTSPSIDLYMQETVQVAPHERALINLKVGFDFPNSCCGLVKLRDSAVRRQRLFMNPMVVGKFFFYCTGQSTE